MEERSLKRLCANTWIHLKKANKGFCGILQWARVGAVTTFDLKGKKGLNHGTQQELNMTAAEAFTRPRAMAKP